MPSKSKSQQRLMGVAYAVKSGDMQLSDVDTNYKDKVKDLVDGMTLKQLKDFAETKHDGLPEVKEGISPANIGGMGPIQLPTDSQPGSGDVPAGTKSKDDEEDEKELKENMKGLITSFESFVQEARDLNDPVAMKMRAAQAKRNAKKDEPKKPEVSPAKAKKIAQLKAKKAQLMRDMEQEAEPSGGPIADRYGAALDKIDKQIAKLSGKKEKGYKLTEAYNEDDINMSYGFFGTIIDTAKSEKEALKLFDEGVAQLQRAPYRLTEEEALAVLNSKMGRKAADQINDGQADSAVLGLEQYYGKKLKMEIARVQRAAVSESTEAINEWGGSDQYAMNQSIHRDMRKPKTMPSPFDKRLRSVAADAVDFYWDDWEEYKSDYEGLVDNAVRSYLRAMFPKEFNMMVRMFEPVDEALVLENMFDGVKSLADELNAEIYKATLKNGSKTATINATTTTKTWDDGAPVLKYLARGKAKKMSFDFYYRPFTVLHDVAHGWFYFTDGRKWYGLHSDEGYFEPEDLPFDLRVVDSVDEALINESVNKDVYTLRDAGFDAKTRGNSILVSNLDIPGEKDTVIWWVPGRTPILPNYGKSYNKKCETVEDLLDLLNNLKDAKGVWESEESTGFEAFIKESTVNEGRSIAKIQKEYSKVINDMKAKVESWKECKANGDTESEAACLAELKDLTAKKKDLMSELDDAVGLKDLNVELAESLDEARSWGTFGTPEAKKVIKQMDKSWDKFSKTVSKAHADFRSDVKSVINSEDGGKSGITDSEGDAYITSMVEQFVKKEFMIDQFGDISRRGYMNDLYESNEVTEAKAWDKLNKIADKKYGEFGFATLDDDQMARHIDMEAANKLAEERYGEFGFATLSEDEMESLINNNPKLVK